jgi:hypothetical protein
MTGFESLQEAYEEMHVRAMLYASKNVMIKTAPLVGLMPFGDSVPSYGKLPFYQISATRFGETALFRKRCNRLHTQQSGELDSEQLVDYYVKTTCFPRELILKQLGEPRFETHALGISAVGVVRIIRHEHFGHTYDPCELIVRPGIETICRPGMDGNEILKAFDSATLEIMQIVAMQKTFRTAKYQTPGT